MLIESRAADDGVAHRIAARVAALRDALDIAGDRLSPAVAARARADLDQVVARLRIGVDRTVVALVGGTGSGKSSLFNAISGLRFAEVGVRRPTTAQVAACTWGGRADELLDVLEVDPDRRIQRESSLDRPAEAELAGLVLLDMPDHDSIAPEHARLVDRLLPLVDLLVWVVDPQKYADHALHGRYLRALVERQHGMLVLVNQVDTVPGGAVGRIAADVTRLLEEDGLNDVRVVSTSVATGAGIREVRELLARVVAGQPLASRMADLETSAVADRLEADLAARASAERDDGAVLAEANATAVERLSVAGGVDAVQAAIRDAVASPRRRLALVGPGVPSLATVASVREGWVEQVGAAVPERWAADLDRAAPGAERLRDAISERLAALRLPATDAGPHWRWAAVIVGVLSVLAALLGAFGGGSQAGLVAAGVGALVTLACVVADSAVRRREAARRSAAFGSAAREAVGAAVDDTLGRAASRVLSEHAAAVTAVERAQAVGRGAPPQRAV